jgi:hypothetical protein
MSPTMGGDRPDVIVVGDIMADVTVSAGTLAEGGDVNGEGPHPAGWRGSRASTVLDIHGRAFAHQRRTVGPALGLSAQGRAKE